MVPYGPGGVADVGMRILADKLSPVLKQQVVVENRPGAGGIIAAKAAATAAPDGYTLLMTGNNYAIAPALFKSLPYNILTDFKSTSTTSYFDLLLVTRTESPLKSLQDVIKSAKANPRQAQHRHHQPRQYPEPCRRTVPQRGRCPDHDCAVPDLGRHGDRGGARRRRCGVRVLRGGTRPDRGQQGPRAGVHRARSGRAICPMCRPRWKAACRISTS